MEINMNDKKYLKWYQKLAYGSGDLASNCSYGLVSSFLLLYLSDVMGLKTNIIGTLMLVSKVFDGVTDVFFWQYDRQDEKQTGKSKTVDAVCTDRRISLPGITFFQSRIWDKLRNMHISLHFIPV